MKKADKIRAALQKEELRQTRSKYISDFFLKLSKKHREWMKELVQAYKAYGVFPIMPMATGQLHPTPILGAIDRTARMKHLTYEETLESVLDHQDNTRLLILILATSGGFGAGVWDNYPQEVKNPDTMNEFRLSTLCSEDRVWIKFSSVKQRRCQHFPIQRLGPLS